MNAHYENGISTALMETRVHSFILSLLRTGLMAATLLPTAALSANERRPYIESCGGLLLLDTFIESNFGPNDRPNLNKLFEARDMLLGELIHDPNGQNISFDRWAENELEAYGDDPDTTRIRVSFHAAAKLHYMSRIARLRSEKIAWLVLKHEKVETEKFPEFQSWNEIDFYTPEHPNTLASHAEIAVPDEFIRRITGTPWTRSYQPSNSTDKKVKAFVSIAVTEAVDRFFSQCGFTFAPGRDYWTPVMEQRIHGAPPPSLPQSE